MIVIRNKEAQAMLQTEARSLTNKRLEITTLKPDVSFIELKDKAFERLQMRLSNE